MAYAVALFSSSTGFQSNRRSFSRVSMRSRTLLILVAFVCAYLFSRSFTNLHLPFTPSPGRDAPFGSTPLLEELQAHHPGVDHGLSQSPSKSAIVEAPIEVEGKADAEIGKLTMMYGDPNPIYERALQSHKAHAEEHGYPLFILRQKLLGRLWSKPAYIMSVILQELQKPLDERLKWLFWFDADTFLVNPKIPINTFLPPEPAFSHINFLCGNDHHGLNDGAFLMRVNDWTLHLMAAAISVETFRPEVSLKYSEQSAIEHLVKHEPMYVNKTAIIPQRWYNAFMGPREWDGQVKPNKQLTSSSVVEGDMLVHFAGKGETKKVRMTTFMDAYEKDRAAWQVDLKDTEYEKEIEEFWEEWALVEVQREKTEVVAAADGAAASGTDTKSLEDRGDKEKAG